MSVEASAKEAEIEKTDDTEKQVSEDVNEMKTVTSALLEAKREPHVDTEEGHVEFGFKVEDLLDRPYKADGELWCLWFSKLLDGITTGVEEFCKSPIEAKSETASGAIDSMISGIERLITESESLDRDISNLVAMKRSLEELKNREKNELTLVLNLTGNRLKIEQFDSYIEDINGITVDARGVSSVKEEATLREQYPDMLKKFNDYYNRPSLNFRRELHISLKRVEDSYKANFSVTEHRVKYSRGEKAVRLLKSLIS